MRQDWMRTGMGSHSQARGKCQHLVALWAGFLGGQSQVAQIHQDLAPSDNVPNAAPQLQPMREIINRLLHTCPKEPLPSLRRREGCSCSQGICQKGSPSQGRSEEAPSSPSLPAPAPLPIPLPILRGPSAPADAARPSLLRADWEPAGWQASQRMQRSAAKQQGGLEAAGGEWQ